jgi:hypothetical protein
MEREYGPLSIPPTRKMEYTALFVFGTRRWKNRTG